MPMRPVVRRALSADVPANAPHTKDPVGLVERHVRHERRNQERVRGTDPVRFTEPIETSGAVLCEVVDGAAPLTGRAPVGSCKVSCVR